MCNVRYNQCEGRACMLLERKNIRGPILDNAQIESSSTLSLILDVVFMVTKAPVFEGHLAKRTQFQ